MPKSKLSKKPVFVSFFEYKIFPSVCSWLATEMNFFCSYNDNNYHYHYTGRFSFLSIGFENNSHSLEQQKIFTNR